MLVNKSPALVLPNLPAHSQLYTGNQIQQTFLANLARVNASAGSAKVEFDGKIGPSGAY